MARTSASRKYQVTFNNPEEHGFSHDVIKTTLETFKGVLYWCMGDEIASTGTYHTHLYVVFRNAVEFSNIHKRFLGAHIEACKGSHQENRDYVRKEGKYLDDPKHDTSVPGTFEESGELPPDPDKRQKQSEAIMEMVLAGASTGEILRAYPSALNHQKSIDAARQEFRAEQFRNVFRPLQVEYIWGKTGVGKTRYVMEKHGMENVYRVTNYKNPFDSYNGEEVILFDEFRSSLDIADMLKYLDGYPVKLPARYGDREACFTIVYVISNIPFESQYPDVQRNEPETWEAFKRRFNGGVYEMLGKDDMPF